MTIIETVPRSPAAHEQSPQVRTAIPVRHNEVGQRRDLRSVPLDDACRYALAASASSVEHPGTALCTRADVERIHDEIVALAS